jgi:hypothetical protein
MNAHAEINDWEASGTFLVWEPDLKSCDRHRLVDSDRPATTFFKKGRLTINGGTVALEKNRHFVRVLTFLLCTPLWGGLAIGLAALAWPLFGHSLDNRVGAVILITLAIAATACAFLIGRLIKPIQRQYALAQVANVQLKLIQLTRNNVPVKAGRLGVDFCVVPPEAMDLNHGQADSLKFADAQRCSFVTFIAESQSEASSLEKWLPKQQVPLTGKRDPNIPPQQTARWVESPIPSVLDALAANRTAAPPQQRYRHNANPWGFLLGALFFGMLMLMIGHGAATNHQGLIINGIIRFGPTGATIFHWLMAIVAAAGFLLMASLALQGFINPHALEIRLNGVVFWSGWLKPRPAIVPFAAIQSVGQQQNVKGGARTMVLVANNRQFRIQEANFANRQTYDTIHAIIVQGQQQVTGRATRSAVVRTSSASQQTPHPPPDDDSRYLPKE